MLILEELRDEEGNIEYMRVKTQMRVFNDRYQEIKHISDAQYLVNNIRLFLNDIKLKEILKEDITPSAKREVTQLYNTTIRFEKNLTIIIEKHENRNN